VTPAEPSIGNAKQVVRERGIRQMPIPEGWLVPSPPLPVDELGGDGLAEDLGGREPPGVPSAETGAESTTASSGSQRGELS
jgi:hypothetical protein